MKKVISALTMVLVMLVGGAEAIVLPSEGEDLFEAEVEFDLELNGNETSSLQRIQRIPCGGSTTIRRNNPNDGVMIETEIVAMDLSCSNGIRIGLDQRQPSTGTIAPVQPDDPAGFVASFFDVFLDITLADGMKLTSDENSQPVRIQMQTTAVHVPFCLARYFGVAPIAIRAGNLIGRLTLVKYIVRCPKQETVGEVSPVFSCFYECKPTRNHRTWLELTTLMLVNQSRFPLTAQILFLDGNERPVARTSTQLSSLDLDEVNVCETLDQLSVGKVVAVPSAGLIEVVLTSSGTAFPRGGAYGWIKNLTGKFRRGVIEPFDGTVQGIAKTECRLVGPNVITAGEIFRIMNSVEIPSLNPVLIENTRD